jgi:hypothetical protein
LISFNSDTTLRWACRTGDYILWARFQGVFSPPGDEYKIADIWELVDGNFVTITNRLSDLPDWFDLHPLEVSGPFVLSMQKRLNDGYNPQEPIDGPNLWRLFAGDRLVWVGPDRKGVDSENGVLGLVDFRENALVYGEPFDISDGFPSFGGFDQGKPSPGGVRLCRDAWKALSRLGLPRTAAADNKWNIG